MENQNLNITLVQYADYLEVKVRMNLLTENVLNNELKTWMPPIKSRKLEKLGT